MHEADSGLIDIIEPAAPVLAEAGHWPWIAAASGLLLLMLGGLLLLWKKKWPAYLALKRLRELRQQIKAGALPPDEGVLMLALELRDALGVKRLLAMEAPAACKEQDRARWPEFLQQLDAILYRHGEEPESARLAAIFEQTEYWLRRYSRSLKFKKYWKKTC